MKTCPFCAEEIQDAAIVCKHCGRDLAASAVTKSTPSQRKGRKWPWIVIGLLIVSYFIIQASRSDYLAFDQQREDWHRRCDRYRGVTASDPDAAYAAACARELQELVAYAKSKGWQ